MMTFFISFFIYSRLRQIKPREINLKTILTDLPFVVPIPVLLIVNGPFFSPDQITDPDLLSFYSFYVNL